MAEVNEALIDKLSQLCRIACKDEDKPALVQDLQAIINHVEKLAEVPTENVKECDHVLGLENVVREDEVGNELPRETFLDNAPDQVGGFIRVPPVINKQGKQEDK